MRLLWLTPTVRFVPAWHVMHVPPSTPEWSNTAGRHALVEWHFAHMSPDCGCCAGLPVARVPLWQLAQLPITEV